MTDAEEQMKAMVDALELGESSSDSSVALLGEVELGRRFSRVTQQLLDMGEAMQPKTDKGRDLHAEREDYMIEMKRRGMR